MPGSDMLHVRTPLLESLPLSRRWGKQVLLKMENMQPAGSFKIRGIGLLCQTSRDAGVTRFVSSSGGNAGYAAAYAGRSLGAATTVLVPTTTPAPIRHQIAAQGAEVRVVGDVWDETHEAALGLAQDTQALYVSPFDHPLIWQGHATIIDEIVEEVGAPDAIVVSVGGGGLLCGVLEGLKRHGLESVTVAAVETEGTASLATSLREGRLVTLERIAGVARSLGAKTVAQKAFEWSRERPVRPVVVSDAAAAQACVAFADDHRCLVEPACGASLSLAYSADPCLADAQLVVCGGIGVDLALLQGWRDGAGNA